jgi:hypothetical protein
MQLKEQRFETLPDIQRESQAVLDSIKENDFHVVFQALKNKGIAVLVPKEIILNEMAAKIQYVKLAFLFELVGELSDTTPSNRLTFSKLVYKICKETYIYMYYICYAIGVK